MSRDNIILGIGYNGFPRGCRDEDLPWAKAAASGSILDTKYPYVRLCARLCACVCPRQVAHPVQEWQMAHGGAARHCLRPVPYVTHVPADATRCCLHVPSLHICPPPLCALSCCMHACSRLCALAAQVVHAEANALLNKNQAQVAGAVRRGGVGAAGALGPCTALDCVCVSAHETATLCPGKTARRSGWCCCHCVVRASLPPLLPRCAAHLCDALSLQ